MTDARIDLSLVLACYNEGDYLEENVRKILAVLEGMGIAFEVIIVDDASKNDTRRRIEELLRERADPRLKTILHEQNAGRGGAVTAGFRAASGAVLGYVDVDLEVDARYIPACYEKARAGADCVVGRRSCRVTLRRFHRNLSNWGYWWLRERIVGGPRCDTESGYKFFRREAILPALERVQDQHWFWDTEVMIELFRAGCSIEEVPCEFVRRMDKKSTVRLLPDTIAHVKGLLRLRRRLGGRARRPEGARPRA
ncbi:MAG: glycosyltransferase family 2 protein [Planctomycetes bacterium]|nr:glycosyltransferase family 2 protein [Planctomycetota bacterium]